MYSFIRSLTTKELIFEQAPTMSISWIIAELFYKFHSFTLECAAFLVTWFVFDALVQMVRQRLVKTIL